MSWADQDAGDHSGLKWTDICGGHLRNEVFSRTRTEQPPERVTRTRSSYLLESLWRYEKVLNFD